MNPRELIERAKSDGRRALTESESKEMLREFNVPVVDEQVVHDIDGAVAAAERIGYPLVLKGMGATLMHKTERGLVHLELGDGDAVRKAAAAVIEEAREELEGMLLQPHIRGNREFVAGLFRDRQFGPVVMFGLGGVFTEALSDVAFRVAPLMEADALDMLREIRAQALLGDFRGEAAARRDELVRTIMGLSRLGSEMDDIAEIDINPLILSHDGSVLAVDALVVLGDPPEKKEDIEPVDPLTIRHLFYPRSVAFVGASGQMGKWGHMLVTNTISGGYQGDMYLVNAKGGTIAGREVYRSVLEIPGPVDLGIVTIPAAQVMELIDQFKEKGIRFMLLITSGFGETGNEGKELERELITAARRAGILILGPNTMGICNPHKDFYCLGLPVKPMPGSTAVVAQSGNLGVQLLAFAEEQAIGVRGFCGSGNEAMLTVEDFIEGFEVDELTKIVMLYVESVKDGRRFFEGARRVGKKKPIVLLKGGQTGAGNRAAASHTGALSTDSRIFDAVCRQAGIVKVDQSMDLLDLSAAFSSLPLPKGNRVGILTLGGGWGVITADMCIQAGLEVPEVPDEILRRIDRILPPYWSRSNPADIVGETDNSIPGIIMEEFLKWDECDAVINLGILGRSIFVSRLVDSVRHSDPSYTEEFLAAADRFLYDFEKEYIKLVARLMEKYEKPIFGVKLLTGTNDQTVFNVEDRIYKSVFYPTPERAVRALSEMYNYYTFIGR
ncbi:MAG: acetate--CoA ligase family protein [Deltaproteobacteria bacterium]|nr:acetate--CoA ligase family protein [Deltaproteobacteria bacterium]